MPGGTIQFSVTGRMGNGTVVGVNPTFTATGGSITSEGRYTAGNTSGTYAVIARLSGGLFDQASVSIGSRRPPAIARDRIELLNPVLATEVERAPGGCGDGNRRADRCALAARRRESRPVSTI